MRTKRKYSPTEMYHVVIRGVNKQNIFFYNEDKRFFLSLMNKYSKKLKVKIHAYCLMENHVHFLLSAKDKNLSSFMQVVTSVYARFFNKKYDRIGHLFQNRFVSEVILDENYYKIVLRYILLNPEKAQICKYSDYKWSSYKQYSKKSFLYTKLIFSYFRNVLELQKFLNQYSNIECIDIELRRSEKEIYYIEKIKDILKSDSPLIPPDLPINQIKEKVKKLRAAKISIRTISRLTGIMTWIVACT